jgi:hypothetical protein
MRICKQDLLKELRLGVLAASVLCMLMTGPTLATTVVRMELPVLVRNADSIVQGRVEEVYSRWDAGRGLIFTYTSVRVEEPMKGQRTGTVLVKQIGGKVGALNLHVSGIPKFSPADRVILFLKDQKDGTFQVLGLNQGKYEIVQDYAVTNLSGLEFLDPTSGRMVDGGFVERSPLSVFKARIREYLQ